MPNTDLSVRNVAKVDTERTTWDKVVILHGLRSWFNKRGELGGSRQKVSRLKAEIFCTDDENQAKCAEMLGMRVIHSWHLDLPAKQTSFLEDQD